MELQDQVKVLNSSGEGKKDLGHTSPYPVPTLANFSHRRGDLRRRKRLRRADRRGRLWLPRCSCDGQLRGMCKLLQKWQIGLKVGPRNP